MESELDRRKRCPKCQEPGEEEGTRPTQDFTKKAITMICRNRRCVWENTGWVISVMLDGSLPAEDAPEVLRAKPKAYPVLERGVSGDQREAELRRYYESIDANIKRS
jgi:hypothetical protein